MVGLSEATVQELIDELETRMAKHVPHNAEFGPAYMTAYHIAEAHAYLPEDLGKKV